VRGEQDVVVEGGPRALRELGGGELQRVDHGVARELRRAVADALGEQVVARARRRAEMQPREPADGHAVELLRERIARLERAQPRLDMAERDVQVEAAQRRTQHGGGVALRQHQVGTRGREALREALHQPRGQLGERLVLRHHLEVRVDRELEPVDQRREQIAMLAGAQQAHRESGRAAQRANHRRHLDDFGPRADDAHHAARPAQRVAPARIVRDRRGRRGERLAAPHVNAHFRPSVPPRRFSR